MKKSLFLLALIFAFAKLQAQDYQISFAGSGATTTVVTVQVQNLTQGTSLNLNGSDVLHLVGTVGIEQISGNGDNSLRIYPNPMTSAANIEFEVSKPSLVTVELFDITGKKVTSTQNNLQAGTQTFNVSGLNTGIYTVSIKSDNFVYSGKIISNCTDKGTAKITFVNSTVKLDKPNLKSTKALVQMQYTTGDRILLKAVSGIYGTIKTFVPTASSLETFNFVAATDFDGNNYTTVTIGTQVWMVENLKTTHYRNGDPIPNVTGNAAWAGLTTGAYCSYNNLPANFNIYGALYNWFTVADTRNMTPAGWHVPTDAEYTTLTSYLGGETVAGGKMKETGTTHWSSPNTGATNQSGFTALPGGYRSYNDGTFYYVGSYGNLWSSSALGATNAWFRYVDYDFAYCDRNFSDKAFGVSVRCVRD